MKKQPVRSKERFLTFGSPIIGDSEINEVVATLKSGWIGTGPRVAKFEKQFGSYIQSPHSVAVNSCTAALHLSLLALKLDPGSEVITSPMTFCATINAIMHAGLTPVLADIDPVTMNIDPSEIERRITSKTRVILPIHFGGRPCDMDAIMSIAQKYNLYVIEDCAHSIESEYKGKKTGTFGQFGCFSFYVTKNIITGEGGMICCRDPEMASCVKILALHGMSADAWKRFSDEGYRHYFVVDSGFKYNMMDLQAAIGIHQLNKIEEFYQRRKVIWEMYLNALDGFPIELPAPCEPHSRHALHLFTVMVDQNQCGISRDTFLSEMTYNNIGVGVHYLSIPEHPFYQTRFGWQPHDFPNASRIGRQTVSLPLSPRLTDSDIQDVIDSIRISLKM
ncbi:MAG: DegT/DnrJ/EryC1/StrS aminotransferase family protein [Chitinispirillaceae bacterium]|nr:DegT/DnrJ/EryC1/StrS aminotransferase family protein [Chitinispirillaceae bacterium]